METSNEIAKKTTARTVKTSKVTNQTNQAEKRIRTTTHCQYFCGVDVSLETLVVAWLQEDGTYINKQYSNTEEGITQFIADIEAQGTAHLTLVTLEATGTYSIKVVFRLTEALIPVALLNPKQSKGFISGVMLRTTKTDERDAQGLALYGKFNRPPIYQLPNAKVLQVKRLRNTLFTLKGFRTQLLNQLHADEYREVNCAYTTQVTQEMLEHTEEKIQGIEERLCTLTKTTFKKLYDLALSIKGVGKATATLLLIVTNGCEEFDNVKPLAKYLGICPTQNESGNPDSYQDIRMRGGISKTGSRQVRNALFMCALSAKRYNLACKDLYERLRRRGKSHKSAMMAVAHKLVKQFFAVIKSGVPFDNEYHLKQRQKKSANAANTKPILN